MRGVILAIATIALVGSSGSGAQAPRKVSDVSRHYYSEAQATRGTVDGQLRTYVTQIEQSGQNGHWPAPLPASTLDASAQRAPIRTPASKVANSGISASATVAPSRALGTTTTPSSSLTIQSPALTTAPPH